MRPFSIVVAMDDRQGIGKQGDLAWRISADLKYFKEITMRTADSLKRNAVIMGRKTWDSLPAKFKPLPGRLNIVLSQNQALQLSPAALSFTDLRDALEVIDSQTDIENVFVIGGGQIYGHALADFNCQTLYITHIKGDFNCDTFFPSIPPVFKKIKESDVFSEGNIQFSFAQYRKSV